MKRLLLAMAVAAAASAGAQPLEFKGVPFGASQAELIAALPAFSCRGPRKCEAFATSYPAPPVSFAGFNVTASAEFGPSGMDRVMVWIPAHAYFNAADALAAKYGAPTSVSATTMSTAAGLMVRNEVRVWVVDGGAIRITNYHGTIAMGSVVITSRAGDERVEKDEEAGRQKAAKDI